MKNPQSLQKTLGIGLTLGVTLLWLLALLGALYVSQSKLNEIFDSALAETAQRLMPLAVVEIINSEDPRQLQNIMPFDSHDEYFVYLVRDEFGKILLQSHNADSTIFNQQLLEGFSSSATHRFYGATAVQDTLHIEVAEPLIQRREAIFEIAATLIWPLVILIPLCLMGTWVFVRYSLRHVLAYRDEIESRDSGNLSSVSVQGLPTEILTIADSVNKLLNRLRRALELERSFTANSAHELRTPIATALAQLQRLQQEVSPGPIKDQTVKIETSLRGLSSLSEKLMQLAKAEVGGLISPERHDLTTLLTLIVDDLRRSSSARMIDLVLPENGEYQSTIDPDAFAILTRNLLDNAIKHGDENTPIEIGLSSEGVLSFVNAGSVIPEESLAQLRRRFVRSNTTAQGSGLGLAIVDAIVSGIGATMTINSPATGREDGFEVIVDFAGS
jgi:two-component system OmpR family sensor kinase